MSQSILDFAFILPTATLSFYARLGRFFFPSRFGETGTRLKASIHINGSLFPWLPDHHDECTTSLSPKPKATPQSRHNLSLFTRTCKAKHTKTSQQQQQQ
jgi:hypothetical protein